MEEDVQRVQTKFVIYNIIPTITLCIIYRKVVRTGTLRVLIIKIFSNILLIFSL